MKWKSSSGYKGKSQGYKPFTALIPFDAVN